MRHSPVTWQAASEDFWPFSRGWHVLVDALRSAVAHGDLTEREAASVLIDLEMDHAREVVQERLREYERT